MLHLILNSSTDNTSISAILLILILLFSNGISLVIDFTVALVVVMELRVVDKIDY